MKSQSEAKSPQLPPKFQSSRKVENKGQRWSSIVHTTNNLNPSPLKLSPGKFAI